MATNQPALRTGYTDGLGQTWIIKINVNTVTRVREQTEVDLSSLIESGEKMADLLFSKRETVAKILYILCERQAKEKGVDAATFAEGLDAESIPLAIDAFVQAVVDFYPRPQLAQAIRETWAKLTVRSDSEMAKLLNLKVDSVLNELPAKLAESVGLTPAK